MLSIVKLNLWHKESVCDQISLYVVTHISELGKTMIILKVSYGPEIIYSFWSANGGLRVVQNPIFNQIRSKLQKLKITKLAADT